jgi:hypothetical protein
MISVGRQVLNMDKDMGKCLSLTMNQRRYKALPRHLIPDEVKNLTVVLPNYLTPVEVKSLNVTKDTRKLMHIKIKNMIVRRIPIEVQNTGNIISQVTNEEHHMRGFRVMAKMVKNKVKRMNTGRATGTQNPKEIKGITKIQTRGKIPITSKQLEVIMKLILRKCLQITGCILKKVA